MILDSTGLDPARAKGALRFSVGRPTTEDEIDRPAEVICAVAERLTGA